MNDTYFVTGALGCIGAWVCKHLVERGDHPVVFDVGGDPRRIRDVLGAEGLAKIRFVTGDITATYLIDERWRLMSRLRSATVPSPNETGYIVNDVAFSTILQRQFVRSSLSGGLEFGFSDYQEVGPAAVSRGNETNSSIFLSYNRSLFSERVGFNTMVRYSMNEGETDWSQFLVSAGLNVVF